MAKGKRNLDHMEAALDHLNGADPAEGADGAPVPATSAARAEIIREACQTCEEFERQIDGLKAEIKAVIETRIVAGLGMKKKDFALARKLYALDQSDRDGAFDAIRECFAALGVGEQLNWLDAVEEGDGAEAA